MKILNAHIEWLESGLPYAPAYQDGYYCNDDERGESRAVFLDTSKLQQRWQNSAAASTRFVIGEIGFGAGLNFMEVVNLWRHTESRPSHLYYLGFEQHPLLLEDLRRLHGRWPDLEEISNELLAQYVDHSAGRHRLWLKDDVVLDLIYGDALTQLQSYQGNIAAVDCWLLDGFRPATNPSAWTPALCQAIADCSQAGTTVASYSVARVARDNLTAAGFSLEKLAGHGRKREKLSGHFTGSTPQQDRTAAFTAAPKQVATVVGAGLAGATMAHSLAKRGWQVQVLDQAAAIATGASGSSQLALRCRVFNQDDPRARFYLQGFLYSQRLLNHLRQRYQLNWHDCGVIQLLSATGKKQKRQPSALEKHYARAVLHEIDAETASSLAHINIHEPALFMPLGGWVDPAQLCHLLLQHPAITVIPESKVASLLLHRSQDWVPYNTDGAELAEATPVMILTNGPGARDFEQTAQLPLSTVRGQSSLISTNPNTLHLNCVVSANRTIFPASNLEHTLSASYHREDLASDMRDQDHQTNLATLNESFPDLGLTAAMVTGGHVGWRCQSQDHFPVAGPAPQKAALTEHFHSRGFQNSKGILQDCLQSEELHHNGLYVHTAHASNGLASCPLISEYLASLINKDVLPLENEIVAALHPARFMIRDLARQ